MPKTTFSWPAKAARFLVVCTAMAATMSSFAHGTVESASPKNGAILATPPAEIRLTFSEQLEPAFTSVKLFDAVSHQEVATAEKARVEGGKTVLLSLPKLAHGSYTARWTTVGHDGHHVHGDLNFSVQ